jgi:hypothetical protein
MTHFTLILILLFIVIVTISAQDVEIEGTLKVVDVSDDSQASHVLVHQSDGTIAKRAISSTTQEQVLSTSGDIVFLSDGGFVKLPLHFDGAFSSLTGVPADLADGDDNTQLSEAAVEGYIDGDEAGFTARDKIASDNLQLGTTATTALAGNTTIPSNNNELTNGSSYITGSVLTLYQTTTGTIA